VNWIRTTHAQSFNVNIQITDHQNVDIQITDRQNVDIQITDRQNVDIQIVDTKMKTLHTYVLTYLPQPNRT
jgi:type 1 fimbria pilin